MSFLTNAKDLAEYFRGSVTYSLWDGAHTAADISAHTDELYTLADRNAFAALLHDCVADSTLTEIFLALFDCNKGLTAFADEANRVNPANEIWKFVGSDGKKFKNDIAAVYVAFNTWLAFYGAPMAETSWSKCPFCGGNVDGGKCKKCKRGTQDCLVADGTLRDMLAVEQSGTSAENPDFWNDIADGAEFDVKYKRPVVELRKKRIAEYRAAHADEIAAKVAAGMAALDRMRARMTAEQLAGNADYDKYLKVLSDPDVLDALAVDEPAFAPACKQFADEVRVQSANAAFADVSDKFCAAVTALFNDYNRPSHTADSLKRYLDKATKLYDEICASRYAEAEVSSRLTSSKARYEDGLVDNVGREIERLRVIKNTAAAYNELCDAVEIMREKLTGVTAEQGLYSTLFAEYNEKIGKNTKFNNLRNKRGDEYTALVEDIESTLEQLGNKEQELNKRKTAATVAAVDKKATALLAKVKKQVKARPLDTKVYDNLYAEYNNLYRVDPDSKIACDNSDVVAGKRDETLHQLGILSNNIKKDVETKKRNVKKAVRSTIISAVALVVLCAVLFVVELGGALPVGIVLSPITPGVSVSDFGDGDGTLDKIGDQSQVIVPDKQRAAWSFKELTVTSVANDVFSQKKNLQSVVLPESLRYLTDGFYNSPKLKTLVLRAANPVGIREHPFNCPDPETGVGYDNGYNMSIYVPKEAYDEYIIADVWATYANCIFPDMYDYQNGISGTLKDKENYCVIVLSGSGFDGDQRFIRVKKGEVASVPMQSADGTRNYNWAVIDSYGNYAEMFDPTKPIESNMKLVLQ